MIFLDSSDFRREFDLKWLGKSFILISFWLESKQDCKTSNSSICFFALFEIRFSLFFSSKIFTFFSTLSENFSLTLSSRNKMSLLTKLYIFFADFWKLSSLKIWSNLSFEFSWTWDIKSISYPLSSDILVFWGIFSLQNILFLE